MARAYHPIEGYDDMMEFLARGFPRQRLHMFPSFQDASELAPVLNWRLGKILIVQVKVVFEVYASLPKQWGQTSIVPATEATFLSKRSFFSNGWKVTAVWMTAMPSHSTWPS